MTLDSRGLGTGRHSARNPARSEGRRKAVVWLERFERGKGQRPIYALGAERRPDYENSPIVVAAPGGRARRSGAWKGRVTFDCGEANNWPNGRQTARRFAWILDSVPRNRPV